jgi:putative nucleotidyltransferase with HDIG domain
MLNIWLPTPVIELAKRYQQAGFELYLVGGAVRDILLAGHTADTPQTVLAEFFASTDLDFTTNAKPEKNLELIPNSFYENTFGTVMVTFAHAAELVGLPESAYQTLVPVRTATSERLIDVAKATKLHVSLQPLPPHDSQSSTAPTSDQPHFPNLEITTFRTDGTYQDHRRPSEVAWGNSLTEDLERRDFTVNAMAFQLNDLTSSDLPTNEQLFQYVEVELLDPHQGLQHFNNQRLVTVGDPATRFQEDALRMLRAVRFAVQLNLQLDPSVLTAIATYHHLLTVISWERIRDEFFKIIASPQPMEGIQLLDQTHLLDHILPELQTGKGVFQGGHHTTDVWTHSLEALAACPSHDPIVRFATLIHDIGKPATYQEQHGTITFYNHEIVGARMAKVICRRLRLSKQTLDRIYILVRQHMFYYQPHNTDASIRRFMRKVGLDNIDDILDLREGDRLGSGARKTSWRLEEMKERMKEQLHQPMEVTDLAVNGTDLMEHLNIMPGPQLGKILQELFALVLENPELNSKETLLEKAKELWSTNT